MKKVVLIAIIPLLTLQGASAAKGSSMARFFQSETANWMLARTSSKPMSLKQAAEMPLEEKEAIFRDILKDQAAGGPSLTERILLGPTSTANSRSDLFIVRYVQEILGDDFEKTMGPRLGSAE